MKIKLVSFRALLMATTCLVPPGKIASARQAAAVAAAILNSRIARQGDA